MAKGNPASTKLAFDDMVQGQIDEATEAAGEMLPVPAMVPVDEEAGVENFALAQFNQGLQGMSAEDVSIPRLRLTQGLTKEVQEQTAKAGQWIVTGFPPVDEVVVMPMAMSKFRRRTSAQDGAVLCRSEDAEQGVGDPGIKCADCPLAQWGAKNPTTGRQAPPECSFGYRYLVDVIEPPYGQCVLELKKTAINAGKMLNGMAAQRGGWNRFTVKLLAKKGTSAKGTFFAPAIVPMPD